MTKEEARAIAEKYVESLQEKMKLELILVDDRTLEFDKGWVFFYNSRKFVVERSLRYMLAGNAPLIVSKQDGTVHETGTAHPVDVYVDEFRRRT